MKNPLKCLRAKLDFLLLMLLLVGMGNLAAQEALIDPEVWLPESGYDPCAEPAVFSYLPPEGDRLCDQYPSYTPSPGCTIANGTTTNYGANTLIENKNFLVNGTWTIIVGTLQDIETRLVYKNCNFKMAPGAQIIVKCNNNKDMAFESCNLFSCDQMWRGISVEHHFTILGLNTPTFRFESCHIEDATSALWFRNPSLAVSFEITDNNFNNNYIGVTAFKDFANGAPQWMALAMRNNQIGTNQNLRPFYSIKVPPLWPLAYAGVSIKKLTTFIGATSTTNSFFRMANGIVCENSVLTVYHNDFSTLWTNGIMSLASHLTVDKQNTFFGNPGMLPTGQFPPIMENGIFAVSSDLNIYSNTFIHRLRHGIWSEQNQNAQVITIANNRFSGTADQNWGLNPPCGICIERSAAAPSAGIPAHNDIYTNIFNVVCKSYVAILVKGTNTATDKLLVRERNDIEITNVAPSGMVGVAVRTGNAENTEVTGNLIDLAGRFQDGNFGIELYTYNSVNFKVKGNNVNGGLDPSPDPQLTHPYAAQCCIHNQNADDANSDICDNTITNSQRGLHFVTGMAEVRENKINNHEFGVDIQPYHILPMLGQQDGRGNQWLGSYISNAALRRGTTDPNTGMNLPNSGQFPQLCRFWAFEDVQPSIYLPASNLIDPNPDLQPNPSLKWFKFDADIEQDYCTEMAPPPGVNDFEMKVAGGLLSDLPATKSWDAKRNLYRKLLENPSLSSGNTVLQSFYTTQQNTALTSFAQTDAYIRNATRYTQMEQQSRDALTLNIQQNVAQADALLNSINYDLSLATPAQMESLADFGEQISTDYGNRNTLDQLHQQQVASLLGNAMASNNALSPANAQEQARKDLNNLVIKALRQMPSTESDYQAALDIANQSSDVVGGAAHEAALLLKICDQSAFVSQHEHDRVDNRNDAPPTVRTSGQKAALKVSPNPSDADFQVQFSTPINGFLRLVNAAGITVRRIEVGMEQTSVLVNTAKLAPGVYFLILYSTDGKTLETTRVVVL